MKTESRLTMLIVFMAVLLLILPPADGCVILVGPQKGGSNKRREPWR